ncbi:MAG: hypothetical protein Aurels2KO_43970 [Aureliella sp.]
MIGILGPFARLTRAGVVLVLFVALFFSLGSFNRCASQDSAAAEPTKQTKTVGPVTVTATVSPSEPRIGDEIVLEIKVVAEPNVQLLMPEFGEALRRFAITGYVPTNNIAADGTTTATQRYSLQSDVSGKQTIPPILIEFIDNRPGKPPTPDDFDAFEILTDPIVLDIASVTDGQDLELKPPLGKLEIVQPVQSQSVWLIAAAAIVALAVGIAGFVFLRSRSQKARQRSAYEVAKWKIDRLRADQTSRTPKLSVEQFFVEISDVVRKYLEQRFRLRAPDLTTDEFLQLASAESELTAQHQQLLGEFLQQADIVKFAGVSATKTDVQRSLDVAANFVEETRHSDESEGRSNA